ncbi:MAG: DUF2478 domain-containing protein [Rhodobacteraceae bacterium]|nr:DUF2478 domain-containing protein [Paracoccaceae bacterium]MCB2121990.1 DUF2478 domain-containing protein [Paracoccaceae bacterium]MCB2139558.1 DUF2478 domain-containing protein [Paracoccaceae bacterium]MCB2144186.1 DUF2478 domain-containing protein [Paracoccaceae bacterium]MCO5128509.1 DUF2478 domain-containing protein [Paracoccaceae bacterium]
MLGYFVSQGRGEADLLLAGVAARLMADGWRLAGAVQVNVETRADRPCEMDLHVLAQDRVVRISQNLGALSTGCRLDPAALETAVGLVERALEDGVQLLVVNKFGKQELEGRGFRPLIGRALADGVPVLCVVGVDSVDGFAGFAAGMEQRLPHDIDALLDWCRTTVLPVMRDAPGT